jgi:hypothetical protein
LPAAFGKAKDGDKKGVKDLGCPPIAIAKVFSDAAIPLKPWKLPTVPSFFPSPSKGRGFF